METILPFAALVAGFLGQAHCAAMCGPLVALLERAGTEAGLPAGRRRALYQAGRLASYTALGALVGLAGAGVGSVISTGIATLTFRVAAALAVLIVGLTLLGYRAPLDALQPAGQRVWQRIAPLTRRVLPMSTSPRAFGAGMLWGFLPCGLVYGAIVLAMAAGSVAEGAATMAAFWAGTLPVTVALGAGAGLYAADPALKRVLGTALVAVAAFSVGTQITLVAEAATAPDWHAAMQHLCSG